MQTIRGIPVTESIIFPIATDVTPRPAHSELRRAAEGLEASFLAEMLRSAGLGEQTNSFSGSTGEAQFASFQREALAQEIVRKGGLGLAALIAASLQERGHGE
nr:rod-binding protein [Roseovarius autotrophicus]